MLQKKLKTTNATIAEKCHVGDETELVLEGCEPLRQEYLQSRGFDPCFSCDCNNFSSNFDSEDKFFYSLAHYRGEESLYTEIGIGTILSDNILNRNKIYFGISKRKGLLSNPAAYYPDELKEGDYLEVSNYRNTNILDFFIDPHLIVTSDSRSCPTPLYVDENSVLGRYEGEIQSISIPSLLATNIIDSLTSFTKSINLKAYKLYCKIINCSSIVLSKSKLRSKPPKGTIIWDADDELIKFYNGKVWRVIQTSPHTNE